MKKAGLIVAVGLLLSGCSYSDLISLAVPTTAAPLPSATATVYRTPTNTPTITPTQPTPTFTLTPTLIYPNGTPVPSSTPTAFPTLFILGTQSPTPAAQPLLGNGPFSTILIPDKQLFWGSCQPNSLNVTVKLSDNVKAAGVVMALRLEDVETHERTGWGQAIMDKQGGGVYTYTLTAKAFTHYREFKRAWGQYQFIAYTTGLVHVGETQVYLNSLTIAPCP